MLTLALNPYIVSTLVALFLLVCVVLILTVLIQRPQGGGLSGAFGSGGGSGQTAFGTKTGDALTIATIGMFVLYLILAVGLNYGARPQPAAAPSAPVVTTTSDGTVVEQTTPTDQPTDQPTDLPTDLPADQPTERAPAEQAPDAPASDDPAQP